MEKVFLHDTTFKIDAHNAKAMIEGYDFNGKRHKQAIYCFSKVNFPDKLLTLDSNVTKFQYLLSDIGRSLNAEEWKIDYKYVARLIKKYSISNKLNFWEELCSTPLFCIWQPRAPFERFNDSKEPVSNFSIILLRIYEIDRIFKNNELKSGRRFHKILSEHKEVYLKKPILSDEEFSEIYNSLEDICQKYHFGDNTRIKSNNVPVKGRNIHETNLENIIVERLDDIEEGLTLVKRQYHTKIGNIDLLCKGSNGDYVVIELKTSKKTNDEVVGQVCRYMSFVKEKIAKKNENIRGYIIVNNFDDKLMFSARYVPNLTVKEWKLVIK